MSPAPISGVSSIGITKLGQIDFNNVGGQIKCQQSPLLDSSSRKFDLDSNQIYYTVFLNVMVSGRFILKIVKSMQNIMILIF